jgi:glycosyltransferase involved in cell wall biosynthesis
VNGESRPTPLRVVHLAAYGGPYGGSFIPMLQAARAAVESRGWSFEAVFSSGADRYPWYEALRESGAQSRVAPPLGRGGAIPYTRSLLAERPGPALLHTHFSRWDLPAVFAGRRRGHTAIAWHLHTRLEEGPAAALRNAVRFGSVGRFADRILCVSPEIREKIVRRLAPPRRTDVLTNGIDVRHFKPAPLDAVVEQRARIGAPEGVPVLLMFAWDWETKGGELLLETIRELHRRGRDVHAAIVGSEQTARAQADRLGVAAWVQTIPPVQDTASLYGAAEVFIAASVAEGMPFALLEALACGTPVVGSDIPAHRFAAEQLPACRLAPRLPAAFADAVEAELAATDSDRDARLAASRAWIERELSLQTWSERLRGVYEAIAHEHGWDV